MRRAIFPGSFDPFTVGHEDIVLRGLDLFDEIIVCIGTNSSKRSIFTVENRIKMIRDVFKSNSRILVESYSGLTVEFAKEKEAKCILRGLRTSADFEYERAIAQVNKKMTEIDSVFLLTKPEHTPVTSTIVRDILLHNGDVSSFLPAGINVLDYVDDGWNTK